MDMTFNFRILYHDDVLEKTSLNQAIGKVCNFFNKFGYNNAVSKTLNSKP